MTQQVPPREPLKPNEQYILDRMRWIDKDGHGCFAKLDTIRKAATPERYTYSLAQTRRMVRRLRHKGVSVLRGLHCERHEHLSLPRPRI